MAFRKWICCSIYLWWFEWNVKSIWDTCLPRLVPPKPVLVSPLKHPPSELEQLSLHMNPELLSHLKAVLHSCLISETQQNINTLLSSTPVRYSCQQLRMVVWDQVYYAWPTLLFSWLFEPGTGHCKWLALQCFQDHPKRSILTKSRLTSKDQLMEQFFPSRKVCVNYIPDLWCFFNHYRLFSWNDSGDKTPSAQWLKAGLTKQSFPHICFSFKVKKHNVLT